MSPNTINTTRISTRTMVEDKLNKIVINNTLLSRLSKKVLKKQILAYCFNYSCCSATFEKMVDNKLIRFVDSPAEANLLLICQHIASKNLANLQFAIEQLSPPKLVIALGSCTINKDFYAPASGPDLSELLQLDLIIDHCPRDKNWPADLGQQIAQIWQNKVG